MRRLKEWKKKKKCCCSHTYCWWRQLKTHELCVIKMIRSWRVSTWTSYFIKMSRLSMCLVVQFTTKMVEVYVLLPVLSANIALPASFRLVSDFFFFNVRLKVFCLPTNDQMLQNTLRSDVAHISRRVDSRQEFELVCTQASLGMMIGRNQPPLRSDQNLLIDMLNVCF